MMLISFKSAGLPPVHPRGCTTQCFVVSPELAKPCSVSQPLANVGANLGRLLGRSEVIGPVQQLETAHGLWHDFRDLAQAWAGPVLGGTTPWNL